MKKQLTPKQKILFNEVKAQTKKVLKKFNYPHDLLDDIIKININI